MKAFIVAAAAVALDQATKSLALSNLSSVEPVPLLGDAFRLVLKFNEGAAFSAGVYDTKNRQGLGQVNRACAEIADGQYHVYQLGSTKLHGDVYL
ncbi:MAG TPA: signal peptidase II, partial [Candidatus Fermentibacter sp.]|nr:signal peptidase II [Candidatus Fermentibacter sp.]